jgi:uncharacterized protein involved in response to NO
MMITTDVDKQLSVEPGGVLFRMGFRPFFMAAGLLAVFAMAIWMGVVVFAMPWLPANVSPPLWHAHEMIFGYGLAVVAGFLLTAVRNWTGIQTLHGRPLQALLLVWVLARLTPFVPGEMGMLAGALCNSLFIVGLSVALTVPVVQAKLWKNMAVVSKLYFFLPGQIFYSLDQFGMFADGQRMGIYIGLYMTLSLLLVLSRRVLPMFIERGVGGGVSLRNNTRVDLACFVLFLVFSVTDIFFNAPLLIASLAAVLAMLHTLRLSGWYHRGIWGQPLLWGLYLAYAWMVIGFVLKCAVVLFGISPFLALHAFAAGGIGMMTLAMMARIALGHTGRNIKQPPAGVGWMCGLLMLGVIVRVLLPLVWVDQYVLLLAVSQSLWIAAFLLLLYRYVPILMQPRIDGRWG